MEFLALIEKNLILWEGKKKYVPLFNPSKITTNYKLSNKSVNIRLIYFFYFCTFYVYYSTFKNDLVSFFHAIFLLKLSKFSLFHPLKKC